MTLQVRLVHALGDRLIDLPERSFESPLVVGRAPTAEIQVPDALISRRHCVLYLHEGQWYIQDGKGDARTFVNGQPALEPTAVHSGDVVTLGTDPTPPTLEIDPFGLWQATEPEAVFHEPTAGDAPWADAPVVRNYPSPATTARLMPGTSPGFDQPPQIDASETPEPSDESTGVSEEGWLTAAAVQTSTERFYIPRQNTWSTGMISGTIFTAIAIVAGAAYLYHVRQKSEEDHHFAEQKKVVEQNVVIVKSNNIFEQVEKERKQKALAVLSAEANKPKVISVDTTAAQDPGRQTEEWRHVEQSHSSFKPVEAIVVFNDYLKLFPGSPYAGDVRKYTEDALDAIWWNHITELADARDAAKKEIIGKNRDLAQSVDPEFKKSLQDDKVALEEKLGRAEQALKELNYLSKEKPNLFDPALMTDLRRARNPVLYNPWKESAEKKIKASRGQRSVW